MDLRQNSSAAQIAAPLRAWLGKLAAQAAALDARHPDDRMNEKLVRAAHAVLHEFEKAGRRSADLAECYALLAEKPISSSLNGWSADDIVAAQELVRAAKGLAGVDGEFIALLWRLLVPYASAFRERFLRDGHISFDGLLVRARNLVRDQQRVRADLKRSLPDDPDRRISGHRSDPVRDSSLFGRTARSELRRTGAKLN